MINDYSGRLVFEHVDGATSGNVMPVSVSHIYNTLQAGEEYWNGSTYAGAYPRTGMGWKLNIQQKLCKIPSTGDMKDLYDVGYRYIYTDADGTEHYFYLNDQEEIVDEDGLDMVVSETGGWLDGPKLILKDKSYMAFDPNGYLVRCVRTSDDTITYWHNTHHGISHIEQAEDGAGHSIFMSIDTDGYLTNVTDESGRVTTYSYNKSSGLNRLLTMITYPDGKKQNTLMTARTGLPRCITNIPQTASTAAKWCIPTMAKAG